MAVASVFLHPAMVSMLQRYIHSGSYRIAGCRAVGGGIGCSARRRNLQSVVAGARHTSAGVAASIFVRLGPLLGARGYAWAGILGVDLRRHARWQAKFQRDGQ